MSEPRERELKYRLGGVESWRRLVSSELGSTARTRRQENHYFDSAELSLVKAGAMLRLRRSDGLLLTFKHGGERPGMAGYFDAVEVEEEVPPETLEATLARPPSLLESAYEPAREALRRFGRVELVLIGRLENERRRVDDRYRLEIDRLCYADGSESYEVEIETDDPEGARNWVESVFRSLGVEATPQRLTKLQQLLRRQGVEWEPG